MGTFGFDEADNYGKSSGGTFFSLKDDGDTARVRFMYNSMNDVQGNAVHEIMVGDKRRYINCLRNYNEPMHKCPLCASGKSQLAKLYIPVYDVDSGEVKIWERGKKFFPQLSSLCARYTKADVPLVAHEFDIERKGKKGSTDTTYMIYEVSQDDTRLEDLPEVPSILGGIVLDKNVDEIQEFLDYGEFPIDTVSSRSAEKTPWDEDRNSRDREDRPVRRTPSSTSRRSDAF